MAAYKITSLKTGKFKSGLSLEQALALTKLARAQFADVLTFSHPAMLIEKEGAPPKKQAENANTPKPSRTSLHDRPFWRKKRYAIPGVLFIAFQLIAPLVMAGNYALMSPEARAAYDQCREQELDRRAHEHVNERTQKAAAKAAREAENCWGQGAALIKTAAEVEIVERLKSPRTAKHPWTDYHIADAGKCEYIYTSYVDAENGFGAMVRTNYVAHVKITGKNTASAETLDAAHGAARVVSQYLWIIFLAVQFAPHFQ